MGLKERNKNKVKHGLKRRKNRQKLAKKGLNPDDFYSGGYYVGVKDAVQYRVAMSGNPCFFLKEKLFRAIDREVAEGDTYHEADILSLGRRVRGVDEIWFIRICI